MKGKKCVVIIHFILHLAYFGVKIEIKYYLKQRKKSLSVQGPALVFNFLTLTIH